MKDIELLSLLETNARLSVRDLSDILLEEEENIIQRMDSLEKRKIICGYHTVINWDKASRGRKVMAIYHPAALLRDPGRRPETFDDLKSLQREIRRVCRRTEADWRTLGSGI